MIESIKGLARRTTQRLMEKVSSGDVTPGDAHLGEVTQKIYAMRVKAEALDRKIDRAAVLLEELGAVLKEIGEEYGDVPDLEPAPRQLAEDLRNVGIRLFELAQEQHAELRNSAHDGITHFAKDCVQISEEEGKRRTAQLEYDFFRKKVERLRQAPPTDFSRIPRNERILESWRMELWRATEANKAMCSRLYAEGRRAIDQAVLSFVQALTKLGQSTATWARQCCEGVTLPQYSAEPILAPASLPPNPLPPFSISGTSTSYAVAAAACRDAVHSGSPTSVVVNNSNSSIGNNTQSYAADAMSNATLGMPGKATVAAALAATPPLHYGRDGRRQADSSTNEYNSTSCRATGLAAAVGAVTTASLLSPTSPGFPAAREQKRRHTSGYTSPVAPCSPSLQPSSRDEGTSSNVNTAETTSKAERSSNDHAAALLTHSIATPAMASAMLHNQLTN